MGLLFDEVTFEGRAPDLSSIADKIKELSGLPLIVEDSPTEVKRDLHDMHGRLAFACKEKEYITLCTYRPGAVRKSMESMEFPYAEIFADHLEGLNEPAGTQAIHIRGNIAQEPTLIMVLLLALEALGGRLRHPLTEEDRRIYGTPINETQLKQRLWKRNKQRLREVVIGLLMLPVILPLFCVGLLVRLATMPRRLQKAHKLALDWFEKRDLKIESENPTETREP